MPSESYTMRQPADWLAAFRSQAEEEDMSLSAWIGECCKANLTKEVRKGLSERPSVGAPKRKKDQGGNPT